MKLKYLDKEIEIDDKDLNEINEFDNYDIDSMFEDTIELKTVNNLSDTKIIELGDNSGQNTN